MEKLSSEQLATYLLSSGIGPEIVKCLCESIVMEAMDFDRWCAHCQTLVSEGFKGFQAHLKKPNHIPPYVCGQDGCRNDYTHRKNLYVHMRSHHVTPPVIPPIIPAHAENAPLLRPRAPDPPNLDPPRSPPREAEAGYQAQQEEANNEASNTQHEEDDSGEDVVSQVDLKRSAELAVLDLRSVNYMTSSAIQRVQNQAFSLMEKTALHLAGKVREFVNREDYNPEEVAKLLQEFKLDNPFKHLKTKAQQMAVFKEKFGLILSQTKSLGERFDSRLDPESLQMRPRQLTRSFQYVSIIEILRCVLNDPDLRQIIMSEKASDDEYLRTFRDGSIYASLPDDLKDAIRIILYVDDLEILQALSASAGKYKVSGFYFGIQNLPPELNALLSYIFVTALAYAEDAKEKEVWEPLLRDLATLEKEGLEILIDGVPFVFQVTLVALIGDTAAIHEIIGLLAPSATCFCRSCYVKRTDMWKDGLTVGEPRTPRQHSADGELATTKAYRTATGVSGVVPKIDGLKVFSCITHSVYDIFHDLLQGVCKMEVKLALRYYVCKKKFFTEEVLQSRLKFFDYGFPDIKNRPVHKMKAKYLSNMKSYNLHQTGAQMWLLTRAFGFLFGDLVPEDDKFIQLISLLNQIMCIVFSRALTLDDVDRLESLIQKHHLLFQEIFPYTEEDQAQQQETEQDITEEEHFQDYHGTVDEELRLENEIDEPESEPESDSQPSASKKPKKAPKKIRLINKHHHLLHYADSIKRFGPLILYWCIRYEARHLFFKIAATVMNNFKNPLLSLMDMFQMKFASDRNKNQQPLEIGKKGTKKLTVEECEFNHSQQLVTAGLHPFIDILCVTHVTFKGIDYRPGLFAMTKLSKPGSLPVFSQIKTIYVYEENVYLFLQEWKTHAFEERLNAYHVDPLPAAPIILKRPSEIPAPRLLAKWKKYDSLNVYMCPRSIC